MPQPGEPLTAPALETAIRQYVADEGRRPDVERMARHLHRSPVEVREVFGQLVKEMRARFDCGLMTLLDRGEPVIPTITAPTAGGRIPPREPDKPVLLKPTTTADPEEGDDHMPHKLDREKDLALVKEYQDLEESGATNLYRTLATKHGIPVGTYNARLNAARRRLDAYKKGQDVYGTGPISRIKFQCEACKDSGNVEGSYCTCAIGQRMKTDADERWRQYVISNGNFPPADDVAAANPPAARTEPPVLPPDATGQGVDAPEQTGASTNATANVEPINFHHDMRRMAVEDAEVDDEEDGEFIPSEGAALPVSIPDVVLENMAEPIPLRTDKPTGAQLPTFVSFLATPTPAAAKSMSSLGVTTEPEEQGEPDTMDASLLARVQDLEKLLKDRDYQVDYLRRVITEREECIDALRSDLAAATATIEKHMAERPAPLMLLVDTDGTIRMVDAGPDAPNAEGDEWAETLKVDGRRTVRVWHLTAAWTFHGTVLCVMAPVGFVLAAVPAVVQREAA